MIRAFMWPVKLLAGYALIGALVGFGVASYILSSADRADKEKDR